MLLTQVYTDQSPTISITDSIYRISSMPMTSRTKATYAYVRTDASGRAKDIDGAYSQPGERDSSGKVSIERLKSKRGVHRSERGRPAPRYLLHQRSRDELHPVRISHLLRCLRHLGGVKRKNNSSAAERRQGAFLHL